LFTGAKTQADTGPVLDLGYSDGLSMVSVFEQRGKLPATLAGWRKTKTGGHVVFALPDQRTLTWAGHGMVFTMVADAPSQTVNAPHELPKIASQDGRALRDLRKIAEGAKNDLREGLGPEFADFEIEDLNPKRFMQKHLFEDLNGDTDPRSPAAAGQTQSWPNGTLLAPGERPPFDPD